MTRSGSGLVAEAALPLATRAHGAKQVLVFSSSLTDVVHSVAVVRHDILIAGAIALVLALIGGYLTARWLALRVKRLERAAERVARGEFGQPLPVDSRDELGQLVVTFNAMQQQLQQLDTARKQFIATASHELRTRSSRSVGSSSCSRTTISTRTPAGAFSASYPSRSSAFASCRLTCSTSRGWSLAHSSFAQSTSTWRS